jgi:hypothetical protein
VFAQQPVFAGLDLLRTEPGTTEFTFGAPAIPADFFGPGSDPFTGTVSLDGAPLGSSLFCPNDNLLDTSTIIRRPVDAIVNVVPGSDVIPVEIVELSLVSIQPITVTYNGGQDPELWDIEVDLSQVPAPPGQMTINRTHPNGGTFDTDLPVLPRFTFTRQSDSQISVLDFGLEGLPAVQLFGAGDPWTDKPIVPGSCTSNWCPSPLNPFVLAAPNATHGVRPLCPGFINVPVLSSWMTTALVLVLVAAGTLWIRRRTRRA